MKIRCFLFALVLLSPSAAFAGPITAGVWSQVSNIDGNQDPFWDGASWDCSTCNAGYLIAEYAGLAGLEYLNDGAGGFASFLFDDPVITPTQTFGMTLWTDSTFGRDADGSFTYDSGTGRVSNSWTSPQQFALFRQVGPTMTQYYLGIEDILLIEPLNDRDYNDHMVTFALPTTSVPEPSTLLLFGTAILGLAGGKMRSTRSSRARAC